MNFDRISRRRVLQGTAALTVGAALPLRRAAAAETTVGFVYVGSRDDYGYNQAHAAGAAALKGMPGIKIVEEEKVPETDAVEKTMESMINLDGATLLTGSYNWTRSAAAENHENLVVSDDVRLVSPFVATFERLWAKLAV